jgi:hypothetical protein
MKYKRQDLMEDYVMPEVYLDKHLDTKKICINAGFLKYKLDCMMKLPHP